MTRGAPESPPRGPAPAAVRYNDWRAVELPEPGAFAPSLPVSVVVPHYETPPAVLARTLAGLERQTYPRRLFEVVIVDDGSHSPPEIPDGTALDVRIVRQERRGVGIARARNAGVRAAAHGAVLFLDSDMLPEAGWIAAHARWLRAVSDALTIGFRAYAAMDGIDADAVRRRAGSVGEMLAGRPVDPPANEGDMIRTGDLAARADDPFTAICGGNFGVGKAFYELLGGHDESFARWGLEDTEFAYRAHVRGGLLVPVRGALAWHQGRRAKGRAEKDRDLQIQRGKAAHLIAHPGYRSAGRGRIFQVPQFVATLAAGDRSAERIIEAAAALLADRAHDLALRIEIAPGGGGERLERLRDEFGPDPRVRVAPDRPALDEFPASPFHVSVPAAAAFPEGLAHRLRARLKDAAEVRAVLPGGAEVSMTRAWALHRARRAGGAPGDYGDSITVPASSVGLSIARPARSAAPRAVGYPAPWDRWRGRWRDARGAGAKRALLVRAARLLWRRAARALRPGAAP